MRDDEKVIYGKLVEVVQGTHPGAASNAAMNLVALLIVGVSPSLDQAEKGAQYAAQRIALMVREHWKAQDSGHRGQTGNA